MDGRTEMSSTLPRRRRRRRRAVATEATLSFAIQQTGDARTFPDVSSVGPSVSRSVGKGRTTLNFLQRRYAVPLHRRNRPRRKKEMSSCRSRLRQMGGGAAQSGQGAVRARRARPIAQPSEASIFRVGSFPLNSTNFASKSQSGLEQNGEVITIMTATATAGGDADGMTTEVVLNFYVA